VHVHVGLDDPDKAIHVANGMRVHLAVLLALSANSPFWRAQATGLLSARTPIFRAFPRVGIPPHYRDWDDYQREIGFMVDSGVMEDYTYLWYDVRPHPDLGTVEIRVCDSQTRIEHTLGLAALIQAMVKELAEHFGAGKQLATYPWQMLDENKWLAARYGLEAELVDLPSSERVSAKALARRLIDRLGGHAQDLGSASELAAVQDLLARGNGAARQLVVYEANHDLREVMREIVEATGA
jgi:carboxylate-amine ligase